MPCVISSGGPRHDGLSDEDADVIFRALNQMEAGIKRELQGLGQRLADLVNHPGVDVFGLNQEMLNLSRELDIAGLYNKPFDQAILAAVLVRAEQLRAGGADVSFFCTIDSDLQPWDRRGAKPDLARLYDQRHIWVCGDWEMTEGPWDGWPGTTLS